MCINHNGSSALGRAALLSIFSFSIAACTSDDVAALDGGPLPEDASVAPDATVLDADVSADAGFGSCRGSRTVEYAEIPMRDGKQLHALVDRQTEDCALPLCACSAPTILIQTPYDIENVRTLFLGSERAAMPLFNSPDYNFVAVDWRGFFGSTDAAVMPPMPFANDGYDLVEWIAAQPWSDGQVGTWGASALCVQQYRTASADPPHLKAAVPIFCGMNITYDQVYPGGVMRREYVDTLDVLGFGLRAIYEAHPIYDQLWQTVASAIDPARIEVPMLVIAGWWDLDPKGSLSNAFQALAARSDVSVRDQHRLSIGSWIHFASGGEQRGALRPLTDEELMYFDSERRIQHDSLAFFDLHLRGLTNDASTWAPVRYKQVGEDAWIDADQWPPANPQTQPFYLTDDGRLATTAPTPGTLAFNYDPNDPSPTIGGATLAPRLHHGPTSQAMVLARNDHATFMTAPLAATLRIQGRVSVHLDVSTTGADTDFAVRITDVSPSGDHLLIGEGIRRLELRDDLGIVSPVVSGVRYGMTVELTGDLAYTIQADHRVGLIVTSSNFPRFAQNPNNGDPFIGGAPPVVANNTLYLDGMSAIVLPFRP